jgi:hypothetical protein
MGICSTGEKCKRSPEENDYVSGQKWFGKWSLWAPVPKNESRKKGLDMYGGPIMPS